jgi:ribose/xylose/arabinose/galactoside ABC-type transport system permease subunit
MSATQNKLTKKRNTNTFQLIVIFLILIGLTIIFAALSGGKYVGIGNILTILRQVSINGILAIGMTLVIITGGFDISVGSMTALAGVIVGFFSKIDNGGQWGIGVLLALLATTALGLYNGIMIAKFHIVPFVQTLAMMTIARGCAMLVSDGRPIAHLNPDFLYIGVGTFLGLPIVVWILLFIILLGAFILHYSVLGKKIYAVGGNEIAARNSGINVDMVKIFAYTFSGVLCGIAGVTMTARVSTGLPAAAQGYEMDAIAASVIGGTSVNGGKGVILGTVIGMLLIAGINNGLDLLGVSSFIQDILKGVIITIAMLIDMFSNRQK